MRAFVARGSNPCFVVMIAIMYLPGQLQYGGRDYITGPARLAPPRCGQLRKYGLRFGGGIRVGGIEFRVLGLWSSGSSTIPVLQYCS